MEVLIRGAALSLLLAASACGFVREPTVIDTPRDALLVHSLLSAGSDTVRVLLTRPASGNPPSNPFFDHTPVPVSGAQVRIAGGGVEVVLREAPEGFASCMTRSRAWEPSPPPTAAGPGCYAAVLPGGVRAGTRYTLEVDVPGGERATGETMVPAPAEWIRPADAERVVMQWSQHMGLHMAERESVLLRWHSSAAALEIPILLTEEVYLDARAVDGHCTLFLINPDGSLAGFGGTPVQGDSLRVRAHLANCVERGGAAIRPDSASVSLLLAAYDESYAAYAEGVRLGGRGIREDRASRGVRGAYGVFGSVAPARRRVVFILEGA